MIDKQIIDWLLDSDISIQFQVLRDLLIIDKPDLKARISKEGWGAKIFSFHNVFNKELKIYSKDLYEIY